MIKIVKIISFIAFLIALIYSVFIYVLSSIILSMHTNYKTFDDYQTFEHEIDSILIVEETVYIDDYFLSQKSLDVFLSNQGLDLIKEGDIVTLSVGQTGWGDSFIAPIVMIEKDGVIYLDFETGVNHLIDAYQEMVNSVYKALILPVSIAVVSLSLGIVIIIKERKISKHTKVLSSQVEYMMKPLAYRYQNKILYMSYGGALPLTMFLFSVLVFIYIEMIIVQIIAIIIGLLVILYLIKEIKEHRKPHIILSYTDKCIYYHTSKKKNIIIDFHDIQSVTAHQRKKNIHYVYGKLDIKLKEKTLVISDVLNPENVQDEILKRLKN